MPKKRRYTKYEDDDILSLNEAADYLGISARTVSRYRQEGRLPYLQYSPRKIMFIVSDLKTFQDSVYRTVCLSLE
jgi:excisionase family DNA binding protein